MEDKQAEVLKEYSRARLNEEAVNVERIHFYKTDKRVNPKQEDPFWFSVGDVPILVSAPHAVRHYRQKKIKMSDQFTGAIVYLLNKLTGCSAIAATKLYGGDPNVDNPCIYKEKIHDLCARQNVKYVLDIHGSARESEFDIDIETNRTKNLLGKTRAANLLEGNFQDFGLPKISRDYFKVSEPNSVASYVARELGIPALQIEINKQFRVPAQNPQGFHRLMGALIKSIHELTPHF
ncbi:hypothetical protein Desor_3647 [Desulfosporosinus orientis DSM 765]|uniref:N-formylglutamate amidohydrolase n=1 Tax=Desulfosporosinus orientis (strain ATCC 19365 / DSM 765 / NCIMB 8382 / VKM B-1628 / Singapore I) TaxID=768706 RepID=G7WIQ1_DESOD|nr:hypothetical protein [Desulfosporosinus orientis]AET69125.1 hypothetical protein Desor_3647 [Desulfosporosinus orientis DSM 765]